MAKSKHVLVWKPLLQLFAHIGAFSRPYIYICAMLELSFATCDGHFTMPHSTAPSGEMSGGPCVSPCVYTLLRLFICFLKGELFRR